MIRLAGACLGEDAADVDVAAIDDGFFDVLAATKGIDGAAVREQYDHGGPERMLDLTLRTGRFGDRYGEVPDGLTLDRLKAEPHGINFGPNEPCLAEILTTEDGKVHLTPSYITDDLPRLAARLGRPADDLVLVSRRHLRSNNSWMHNVNVLVKGKDRCTLLVHPADAERFAVADGELARVTSAAGTVDVTAEITEDIRAGVVSLPHGWGHNLPGTRLSVANDHAGVNSNVLAPVTFVDVISGNAAVNGIPVTIGPAASA
jgi:anaerobic selenocysteine-containing dehydrogenase